MTYTCNGVKVSEIIDRTWHLEEAVTHLGEGGFHVNRQQQTTTVLLWWLHLVV